MNKKILKFGNVIVNKKKIHASIKLIALNLVNIGKIVISDQYFKVLNILLAILMIISLDLLCIILPQMSGLVKYDEIWNKIKKTLNIKFHSQSIYDENT